MAKQLELSSDELSNALEVKELQKLDKGAKQYLSSDFSQIFFLPNKLKRRYENHRKDMDK
jgi:hypothetical protein